MTAMNTQMDKVCALLVDVLGGQECKHTSANQQQLKMDLSDKGWDVAFGPPVEKRRRGRGSVKPGGVCIMARKGLNMQWVAPECEVGKTLWASGRFIHFVIP